MRGRVPQEFLLGQMLLSVLVNDLDDGTEFTLTRFADDTEVAEQANTVEGRVKM